MAVQDATEPFGPIPERVRAIDISITCWIDPFLPTGVEGALRTVVTDQHQHLGAHEVSGSTPAQLGSDKIREST